MIVLEESRTNISTRTRPCIGTSDRPCGVTIDASAGRMRCGGCQLEQNMINARTRGRARYAPKRKGEETIVRLRDGLRATMNVKRTIGISGLPMMGIAYNKFAALIVIKEGDWWVEIDNAELDRRIATKTRQYLDQAERLLKRQ